MAQRPPERDDLDTLLGPLIEFAQLTLRRYGEFFPFGNVMLTDGEVRLIAADIGGERPASQDVIDQLVDGMRLQAKAGEIRATGICYDVRINQPDGRTTDAIAVELEHRLGDAVTVFVPYSKGRLTGLKFGDLEAGPAAHRVFVAD